MLAETYLRDKRYTKVRDLADEMLQRPELADFYYQMYEVVGRSWLQQAPPDFDKAREAFARVIGDKNGRRTPTAARSQLLIGDTWVNQDQHAKALPEYQKVYYNYAGQPRLQAAGLFQAAACEEALGQTADALQSYKTLVDEFPASEYAERARARIRELNPAGEARPR